MEQMMSHAVDSGERAPAHTAPTTSRPTLRRHGAWKAQHGAVLGERRAGPGQAR